MIKYDGDLTKLKELMDPKFLKQAERSALKSVQRKTATRISKKVRETYNVTARAIADRLKLSLGPDGTEAYLWYVGSRIGLINFSAQFKRVSTPRGKRFGATAKIMKKGGKFVAKGGFIAKGKNGNLHIYQRQDLSQSARLPLISKKGPAIPQMVQWPEVLEEATKFIEQEYPKDLANRLEYFLEKQMSR